jgi:hypothetical protein
MPLKIASFLLTLIVDLAAGAIIFFMMLIAMNGYSESDAQLGLLAYIILAVITSIAMGVGSVIAVGLLIKREFSSIIAGLTAVPVFAIVGIVIEIVSSLIGIGIAEFVRVNY